MEEQTASEKSKFDTVKSVAVREGKKYFGQLEAKVGPLYAKVIVGVVAVIFITASFSLMSNSAYGEVDDAISTLENAVDDLIDAYDDKDADSLRQSLVRVTGAGEAVRFVMVKNKAELDRDEQKELFNRFNKSQVKAENLMRKVAASGLLYVK